MASAMSLPSVGEVRHADAARLKAVLYQLRVGLDTTARSLVAVRQNVVAEVPREDRREFDSAFVQVRLREVALRNSIAAASNAEPGERSEAQAQVARDYEAYARAVVVAQAMLRSTSGALAADTTASAGLGNESLRGPAE
jgi:hypothetical protein